MASEGSYGAAFSYGRGTHVGQFPHSGHENNETIANVDGLVPEHSSEWFPKLSPKSFREWTVQMKTLDPDSLILPNVDIDAKGKMPESPTKLAVTMGQVEIVQLLPSFQKCGTASTANKHDHAWYFSFLVQGRDSLVGDKLISRGVAFRGSGLGFSEHGERLGVSGLPRS